MNVSRGSALLGPRAFQVAAFFTPEPSLRKRAFVHITTRRLRRKSGVCLPARLVLATSWWIVRLVDEDVIVAGSANHAVNRLVELLVSRLGRMFLTRLLPADRHRYFPLGGWSFTLVSALQCSVQLIWRGNHASPIRRPTFEERLEAAKQKAVLHMTRSPFPGRRTRKFHKRTHLLENISRLAFKSIP